MLCMHAEHIADPVFLHSTHSKGNSVLITVFPKTFRRYQTARKKLFIKPVLSKIRHYPLRQNVLYVESISIA